MLKRNKLRKLSIDLLQEKMYVINEELLRSFMGGGMKTIVFGGVLHI
jgi:hypothetical protein